MPLQDRPDARGRELDTKLYQLALDPPISPGRVLLRQSNDERDRAGRDSGPSRGSGVSPSPSHQIPVPPEQGRGLHKEPTETPAREHPAETSEERSIRWAESGAGYLASEHG